jgi:hypothetical protein
MSYIFTFYIFKKLFLWSFEKILILSFPIHPDGQSNCNISFFMIFFFKKHLLYLLGC